MGERNNSAGVFIRLIIRSPLILGYLENLDFAWKQQATGVAAFWRFGRLLNEGFAGCFDVTPQNTLLVAPRPNGTGQIGRHEWQGIPDITIRLNLVSTRTGLEN